MVTNEPVTRDAATTSIREMRLPYVLWMKLLANRAKNGMAE